VLGTNCAAAAEPLSYSEILQTTKRFWATEPKHVIVNWNPKAPGLANLRMEVVLEVDENRLVVSSWPAGSEENFVAYFDATGAVVGDCNLHTLVKVPQFEPADGGATTGLPAELLAMRLLVLAHVMPTLKGFDLTKPLRLRRDQEQSLARVIYPDNKEVFSELRKPSSILRKSIAKDAVTYEWLDGGGAIFRIEATPSDESALKTMRTERQWIAEVKDVLPMPRVAQLAGRLLETRAIDSLEGEVIAFGKIGPRASASLVEGEPFSSEMQRFRIGKQIGVITVSRASPLHVKQVVAMKDKNDKTVGRIGIIADVEHSKVLCLEGQDWIVTVMFPGITSAELAGSKLPIETGKWLLEVAGK
jgi:hypothetical protein